jgi:methylenetetrahydrofolate reductase (NADPH)
MQSKAYKISFELSPLKTEAASAQFIESVKHLMTVNPSYFSVTYGAGGSMQHITNDTVKLLKSHFDLPIVPHITCIGTKKKVILNMLNNYIASGVDHFVVLRGDMPAGQTSTEGDFHYAHELVSFIREHIKTPLMLEVAVYPECHPESNSMQENLLHLKQKIDAGADRALTQYFYNADAYARLLEDCAKLNITVPIVPGIMPITNLAQLTRFSARCHAQIPQWITKRLVHFENDSIATAELGTEIVAKLCEQLLREGAPELHFYTLNKHEPTLAILKNLRTSS